MLLYKRIRLSGLDTGGSRDRYLARSLKGQIAISGGTEGTGTYGLPPTASPQELKSPTFWLSWKPDEGVFIFSGP